MDYDWVCLYSKEEHFTEFCLCDKASSSHKTKPGYIFQIHNQLFHNMSKKIFDLPILRFIKW